MPSRDFRWDFRPDILCVGRCRIIRESRTPSESGGEIRHAVLIGTTKMCPEFTVDITFRLALLSDSWQIH